jgi:3-oxoadipate enol-lactonase
VRKHIELGSRRVGYLESLAERDDAHRELRTLVLLHAFPLNADMWEPQLRAAPRGWRLIAPDWPGFGDTDPLRDGPRRSLDEFAADVIDLLQALGVDHAVVCGLSMGGYAAFALFRLVPDLFSALVLADTRPGADTEEGLEGRRRLMAILDREGPEGVANDMIPKLLGPRSRERPDVVGRVRELILANRPVGIRTAIAALMARPDSTDLLAAVHCPTLIVVGREDGITPPAEAEKMQRAIPGSALEVIEDAGHLANLEQPDRFNAALTTFLTRRV